MSINPFYSLNLIELEGLVAVAILIVIHVS